MTRAEALDVLAALTAAFPTYPIEKPTAELYVNALATVDAESTRVGVIRWIETQDRYPTVAQLLGACRVRVPYHEPFLELPPVERVSPDEFRRGLETARATLTQRRDTE